MKKKLEAELISIAHRILKLKNRGELDQLQQETLKLYEKISVLKFVEDNFTDIKPTIGFASAEEKLEEVYGLEPEQAEAENPKIEEPKENKKPKAKAEEREAAAEVKPEEETAVAETETETETEEEEEQIETEATLDEVEDTEAADEEIEDEELVEEDSEEAEGTPKAEEPEHKIEIERTEEELMAMEEGAAAVFEKEQEANELEEEEAADAEVITIEPDKHTKVEESNLAFDFAFERKAVPEEVLKKEVTFEDFHLDYKELDFVKKSDIDKPLETPKEEVKTKEDPKQEGLKPEYAIAEIEEEAKEAEHEQEMPKEEPKSEVKKEEVNEFFKYDAPKQDSPSTVKSINDNFGKIISLGLNDRIAFEKHLFGGSADDLNRVLSQLNTLHSFSEAKQFIDDLVKPDYNGWKDKEEYEERFMQLVEKKFE